MGIWNKVKSLWNGASVGTPRIGPISAISESEPEPVYVPPEPPPTHNIIQSAPIYPAESTLNRQGLTTREPVYTDDDNWSGGSSSSRGGQGRGRSNNHSSDDAYRNNMTTFMSFREMRDAGYRSSEAFPTYSGLSNVLDRTGYRSLSQSIRDLNENVRLNILVRAEWLSTINPLANRCLGIRTDFCTSEGFLPKATSKNLQYAAIVQKVLDEYWGSNEWDQQIYQRVLDAGITGEMIRVVPPLFRHYPGLSDDFMLSTYQCGNRYPYAIQRVDLDPFDYEKQEYMHFQPAFFPQGSNCTFRICRKDRINPDEFKRVSGEVFYLGLNRRTGQSRGLSDLTPVIEWLDMHDDAQYNNAERVQLMGLFLFDITLKGAGKQECLDYADKLRREPMESGSVRVHDESEEIKEVTPDLHVSDTTAASEALFDYAAIGLGLPTSLIKGDMPAGLNSNATFLNTPVFAWARNRRRHIKGFLEMELQLAVQVARDSGRLGLVPATELGFTITSRDPDRSNYDTGGRVLKDMGAALTVAMSQGFISQVQAGRIFKTLVGSMSLGFEEDDDDNTVYDETTGVDVTNQVYPKSVMPAGLPSSKLINAVTGQKPATPGGNPSGGGGSSQESYRRSIESYLKSNPDRTIDSYVRESLDRLEQKKVGLRKGRVDDIAQRWVDLGKPDINIWK